MEQSNKKELLSFKHYELTKEQEERLDKLVEKVRGIAELKVIVTPLDPKITLKSFFPEGSVQIITNTARDNYVQVPTHYDGDYLPTGHMRPYGLKLLDHKVIPYPFGFVRIDMIYGNRIIKEQLSRDAFDKFEGETYTFFWDDDDKHYKQYTDTRFVKVPKNNKKGEEVKEAPNTKKAFEILEKIAEDEETYYPIILKYLELKEEFYSEKHKNFVKTTSYGKVLHSIGSDMTIGEFLDFFDHMENFLKQTDQYFKVCYIMGYLNTDEFDTLLKEISVLRTFQTKAILALKRKQELPGNNRDTHFQWDMKQTDDIWIYFNPKEINGNRAQKHAIGPVEKTLNKMRDMVTFRAEEPKDIYIKSEKEKLAGYIYDKKTNTLAPNFSEIERRRRKYEMNIMLKQERELIEHLKRVGENIKL